MKFRWFTFVMLTSACTLGCASISDYRYNCVNKQRAKAAWKGAKACLPEDKDCSDFAKGYQAGYLDVSRNGDGSPPPGPPSCYWGPDYQTAEGLCLVSKWYEGFSKGACDAMSHGRNHWHNLPSPASQCYAGCVANEAGQSATSFGEVQYLHPFHPVSNVPMAP